MSPAACFKRLNSKAETVIFDQSLPRASRAFEWRYTAAVGSWISRAISLVMVVALAATPAFSAICAALCLPVIAHGTSTATADQADPHATHRQMQAAPANDELAARDAGHRHTVAVAHEQPDPVSSHSSSAVIAATGRSCCTSHDTVLVKNCCTRDATNLAASVAASRAAAGVWLTIAPAALVPAHALIPVRSEAKYIQPVAATTALRAPLVLRV